MASDYLQIDLEDLGQDENMAPQLNSALAEEQLGGVQPMSRDLKQKFASSQPTVSAFWPMFTVPLLPFTFGLLNWAKQGFSI